MIATRVREVKTKMKISKKIMILTLIALLVLFAISGCSSNTTSTSETGNVSDSAGTNNTSNVTQNDDVENTTEQNNNPSSSPDENATSNVTQSYQDGIYRGQSDKNDKGEYGDIKIIIKDGKISDVQYKEILPDGREKTLETNDNYQAAADAIKVLPEKLKESQDTEKIDTISSATITTEMFKQAAERALAQAK